MTFSEFQQSMLLDSPPGELNIYLLALWYDGKGDWNKAHSQVDHLNDATACWVHAYLHRKEGDDWNADYWYRKAGKKRPGSGLTEEWRAISEALL